MPQRAIIEEKTGKREVQAYQLTDQQWIGIIEASKAGVLKLPCCGQLAITRDPHDMIRHFAHPPYTLDNCEAKAPDALRDFIMVQVAEMAESLGWRVTTEAKIEDSFCDLLCHHDEHDLSIGVEIETGRRDNEDLLKLDFDLRNNGLLFVQWFFKKGRHGGYPDVEHKYTCSMRDKQEASQQVVEECRRVLSDINGLFEIAQKVCAGLAESGLKHELHTKSGVPDHVIVQFDENEETHRIDLSTSKVKMKAPRVEVTRQNLEKGDTVSQQQKTLIAIVSDNLAAGISLWWDGHPELLADSFKRLRLDIEREDKRRRGYLAQRGSEVLVTSGDVKGIATGTVASRQYQGTAAQGVPPSGLSIGNFAELRLKEISCILRDYFGASYSDDMIDMPLEQIGGQTPRQLVEQTSQSAEDLYVALGYRDPVTKRPIRPMPKIIL